MTNNVLKELGRSGLGVMKKEQAFKMDLHRARKSGLNIPKVSINIAYSIYKT
jgi:hypothetical protein